MLEPLVNDGLSVGTKFSHTGLTRVEQSDRLPNSGDRFGIGRAQRVAVVPEFIDGCRQFGHSGAGYRP